MTGVKKRNLFVVVPVVTTTFRMSAVPHSVASFGTPAPSEQVTVGLSTAAPTRRYLVVAAVQVKRSLEATGTLAGQV